MKTFDKNLIAPCGMNCGICQAYLREKDKCPGCRFGPTKISCTRCKIKSCKERKGKFCFNCEIFPCGKLKHLDERYKAKYGMSEIENLEFIRDKGIDKFVDQERKRWQSGKGTFCVHNKKYY